MAPTTVTCGTRKSDGDSAGVTKASGYQSLHEFAFAIANNLKGKLGCDHVCLGLVDHQRVKLLCMSGFDQLYPRSPGARVIEQAMAECLDAEEPTCFQIDQEWTDKSAASGHRLHKAWHDQTGNAAVASLPLMAGGRCVAVLSLRNPSNRPFQSDQLQKVAKLVNPLAPGLLLLLRANKSLVAHGMDELRRLGNSFVTRGAWGRKVLTLALGLFTVWLVFGKGNFIVSVPCEVVPEYVRHVAAPFEGRIQAAYVKPGDEVRRDQLLVQMDTRDLNIEKNQLQAELQITEVEINQAAADRDIAVAAQANARKEVTESKLLVVNHRIAAAEIRAPATGAILHGDLEQRIGETVPVGTTLLEFAPQGAWSVELQIPEYAASHLQEGQFGNFTTHARPDATNPCTIERVEPASDVVDGKNVFTAVAKVDGQIPIWIRSGMQGVARIDAGRRPNWWVWLHRFIDTVRLQLWKL